MTQSICEHLVGSTIECQAVQTPNGPMTHVNLPFYLEDGSGISIYLVEEGARIKVTDDGATLFHLGANDIDLSDRRRWVPIRNLVEQHGFILSDQGEIYRHYSKDAMFGLLQEVLLLTADIVQWERRVHETGDHDLTLHSKVEGLLATVYGSQPERDVKVRGPHTVYSFDFRIADIYVDAFKPHHVSTASELRKLIDIRNLHDDELDFLMVIDDTSDPKKAAEEQGLFRDLAHCQLLSNLEIRAQQKLSDTSH